MSLQGCGSVGQGWQCVCGEWAQGLCSVPVLEEIWSLWFLQGQARQYLVAPHPSTIWTLPSPLTQGQDDPDSSPASLPRPWTLPKSPICICAGDGSWIPRPSGRVPCCLSREGVGVCEVPLDWTQIHQTPTCSLAKQHGSGSEMPDLSPCMDMAWDLR